jgi:uncharacterized protein YdeI (YjbR/CyaY-like superfamily)
MDQVEVKSRKELRLWLKDNHKTSASIWLVTFNKSSKFYLAYNEIVEEALCLPKDLKAQLKKFKSAEKNFEAFPPSSKRAILEWIIQAKTPETRLKRIIKTATMASENLRANHYTIKVTKKD